MINYKFNRGDRVRVTRSGWTFEGRVMNRRLNLIGQKVYAIVWREDGMTWVNIGVREHEMTKI